MRKQILSTIAVISITACMSASAIQLNVGAGGAAGDLIIGEVIPLTGNVPGANGLLLRDAAMVNTVLNLALGQRITQGSAGPQGVFDVEYYRSTTTFGTLPNATIAGAVSRAGSAISFNGSEAIVVLPQTFKYLIGAYDGYHGGAEIWYIGDLAEGTEIRIPLYAKPSPAFVLGQSPSDPYPQDLINGYVPSQNNGTYRMTSWTAFNPVPEAGATIVLLGVGLLGLGALRRKIS